MNNCGCPQNSPSQLSCPPSISIPVDQYTCDETNVPSSSGGLPLTFHPAQSSFVVPNVGQQSALLVQDGSIFTPGEWIQFVNPSGIFRIISITGNTLQLSNAAADGVSPISGNPAPPYQYPIGAAFVAVGDPRQLSLSEFATQVQTALSSLTSICLNSITEKTSNEEVFLLGYLKSSLCDENAGACLRKQGFAYIDKNGVLHYDGTIIADAFSIPVPEGGIPSNNSTVLNPNNGTGGGFLLPFYNPATGQVSYIDLFSGVANGGIYSIEVSPTGTISLTPSTKHIHYWPEKEIHKDDDGGTYSGYSADVDIATIIGAPLPTWAKYVSIRVHGSMNTGTSNGALEVRLNDFGAMRHTTANEMRGPYDGSFIIPIVNGKINVKVITYSNVEGTTVGPINFMAGGSAMTGRIRVAIRALLS